MSGKKTEESPLIRNGEVIPNSKCPSQSESSNPVNDTSSSGEATPVRKESMEIDDSQSIAADPHGMDQGKPTSNMGALMNIMKTFVGTGVLGLPSAVKNAGLAVGTVGVLLVGTVIIHCMHLLVRCTDTLAARVGRQRLTYAEVAELSMATGPIPLRRFAVPFRRAVNLFLILNQIGVCSVYVVFVAENLQQFVEQLLPGSPHWNTRLYSTAVFAFLLPCVLLRSMSILAFASAVANIITVIGFIIIFSYILPELPDVSERPLVAPLNRFPAFFGTAVFALEGIPLVLPVYGKMRNPRAYPGCDGVLNLASVITICIFTAVGFYGFLKFGEDAKGSITLNLPADNWLYLSVRAMFAVAIFLSYSVQIYVPVKIIWANILPRLTSDVWRKYGEYCLHAAVITITYVMALVVPHLDILIALVGAMIMSSLSLAFPTVIEVVTLLGVKDGDRLPENACVSCRPYTSCCPSARPRHHYLSYVKAVVIFILGVLGAIAGTYTSLYDLVNVFSSG